MFGILTAAAASWDSYDNDTQRRLRNLRNDASDALDQIQNYISRGEQVRGRLPSVMDALLGLALANPTQTTPEILPTSTKLVPPHHRRKLCRGSVVAAEDRHLRRQGQSD
jgi:type II secretory pathway pseudopilin PulG